MNQKIRLGVLVFLIGFTGVVSTLLMDMPLPEGVKDIVLEVFTPWQLKLLNLINPTILLLISVTMGVLLYDKVGFKLPIIERVISKHKIQKSSGLLKYGVIGGLISGLLIALVAISFQPILPTEFIEMGEKFKPPLITKFLYGGLTEEILMRFGVMTFVVWLLFKIVGKKTALIYWLGILISSIIFGLGHLPVTFLLVNSLTTALFMYIIFGNAIGGIVFGWLYWKKGLETAMVAHIFSHIILTLGENILNLY